jgi:hypothetical protein
MRLLAVVSTGACLVSASVGAFVLAVRDASGAPEKRLAVEVVSTDAAARTLTIRSDSGTSTLAVEPGALRSLEGLRPGDRISITTQDPGTGQSRAITATVDGTAGARTESDGAAPPPLPGTVRTVTWLGPGQAVTFRSWDPATRRLVVDVDGVDRYFLIDENADVDLDALLPGQDVLLSWRFNKAGNAEAVIRTIPARATARTLGGSAVDLKTSPVRMRGPVEVLSADPVNRTLRVRDERGVVVTFPVDAKAVVSLEAVRGGDLVLLSWRNDRVTLITKR